MVRTLKRVEDQQKDQVALAEKQFLQLKQQTIRGIGFQIELLSKRCQVHLF